MQITILQTILYTQLLIQAGFQVHVIDGVKTYRGSGVGVLGAFTYADGAKMTEVVVRESKAGLTIDGLLHKVNVHDDGTFDLFVAHSDDQG